MRQQRREFASLGQEPRPPGLPNRLSAPGSDYVVVEAAAHHRVWARAVAQETIHGLVYHTNSYVELATGLNVMPKDGPNAGQWIAAREEIEAFPGGSVARMGQTKAIFANNAAETGALDVEAPDGKRLRSTVVGLYLASADGKSLLLARTKDCQGEILPPNRVIYRDCMEGARACSILYTYTLAGLVQDLLIEEDITPTLRAAASSFGDSASGLRVQLVTEFFDCDPPGSTVGAVTTADGTILRNEALDLGALKMIGPGSAYAIGQSAAGKTLLVAKQWAQWEARQFLVEELALSDLLKALQGLPRNEGASVRPAANGARHVVSNTRLLPPRRVASKSKPPAKTAMLLASTGLPKQGFLWDYSLLAASATNFVFKSDTTYLCDGLVNLVGQTVIEGSSCIKFRPSTTAAIVTTNILCKTGPVTPAVLTASSDAAHGEGIDGGTPSGYYGYIGLDLSGAPAGTVLSNLRFCYLSNAISGSGITLRDVQLLNCKTALASGSTQPKLENVLAYRVNTLLANSSADDLTGINLTAHFCTNFFANTTGTVRLTNCLFACVTNWQCATTLTNTSAFLDSDTGLFQTVGAGAHYLAADSPWRNAGTADLSSSLLADLRPRTTYPPIVFSNVTFSADNTFSPQAQRDTDQVDLGFHYSPLDYVFGGCTANANLTFSPGTAVGWFRTSSGWYHAGHGIHAADSKLILFDGWVDAPCFWVRCNTAMESVNGLWAGGYGPGGITGWAANTASAPTVQGRFLVCAQLASDGMHFRDDYGWLTVRLTDSQCYAGGIGGYASSQYHTNNFYQRPSIWLSAGQTDIAWWFQNCTLNGGSFYVNRYANAMPVTVHDCAFDSTSISTADSCASNPTYTDYDYNAFLSGSNRLVANGPNDILVSNSFNWQAGPLSDFYLPTNSTLIDAGSLTNAALVGLYHFTTTTNLVNGLQVKELNSRLDVGGHFVALGADGKPIDTDGDGIPDYWEDRNGSGTADSGETDWTIYNSPNGLASGSGLEVFTPLK